jgi:hypothetical protein
MRREKNDRRYPGVRGKRPDLKKLKQSEAKERQSFYDSLSIKEKLEHLTRQLVKAGGEAKKQIMRLLSLVETKAKPATEESVQKEFSSADVEAKRVKAKDRRKAERGEE